MLKQAGIALSIILLGAAGGEAMAQSNQSDGTSRSGNATLGNLSFNAGHGWHVTAAASGSLQFKHGPTGLNAAVQPAKNTGGQHEAFLKAAVQQTFGRKAASDLKVKQGITSNGVGVHYGSFFAEVQGKRLYVIPVAMADGQRTQMMMFISADYGSDDSETAGHLLSTARMSGQGSGGQSEQSLEGFYAAFGSKSVVTAAATVGVGVGTFPRAFLPDGQVALSDKAAGDPAAYCRRKPKDCGRYQIAGNKISISRPGSKFDKKLRVQRMESEPFQKLSNGNLRIGKQEFHRIPSANRLKLSGFYSASSGGTTADSSFTAFASSDYDFKRDGRFVKGGSFASTGDYGNTDVAASSKQGPRTGRYSVNGYEMQLRFDDGVSDTKTFYPFKNVLVIDGDIYTKR